jgi:hypothetical protein
VAVDNYEEGLSWGAENDPTHVEAPAAEQAADSDEPHEPGTGSALLVTLGVFGGIFLLYTVGWLIGMQRSTVPSATLFFVFMYRLGQVLAIAAPAAWFVGVLVLARERRAGVRIIWLLVGVVLLAPWPFILGLGA